MQLLLISFIDIFGFHNASMRRILIPEAFEKEKIYLIDRVLFDKNWVIFPKNQLSYIVTRFMQNLCKKF
jgi:hypothetical protein